MERQSQRNLTLSILGIVIILFLLIKVGVSLLANFALLLSNYKTSTIQTNQGPNFVSSPQLNPLPEATNSAELKFSGQAQPNSTIDLYLNDSIIDKTDAGKDGKFSFDLTLSKGDNKIYTRARIDKSVSDPSQSFDVLFKNTPPSLNITSPPDGAQFSKDQSPISITGTTDGQNQVTVNGFWAIVDQNNNFLYKLPLQNGDNQIKVIAVDNAGNKTEKDIKVTYSP